MADKETKLSIVIRTVDRATAKINAIADRFDRINKPFADLRKGLADLREKSGLDDLVTRIGGVGGALTTVLGRVAAVGGVLVGATLGVKALIDGFDDLGDKAEALGVGVDELASLRFAAERTTGSAEAMDNALAKLGKNLGLMRANVGPLVQFVGKVSPVLLRQLKATTSNEEAFRLLADAMAKIKDPAKRAAFATKTLGDASLAPLLARGSKGVAELQKRYLDLAGSQEGAAEAAGEFDDAMKDAGAATDGVKAALVKGLAPALTVIIQRMTQWLTANRADIERWAVDIGKRLPDAVTSVIRTVSSAVDRVRSFVHSVGGIRTVAIAAAAIIAGPLITAVVGLGTALLTTLGRLAMLPGAISAAGTAAAGSAGKFGALGALGTVALPVAAAGILSDLTGGPLVDVLERAKGQRSSGRTEADLIAESLRTIAAARTQAQQAQQAHVTIDIANAPRGTRANMSPDSTAAVDLSVGFQMLPGIP